MHVHCHYHCQPAAKARLLWGGARRYAADAVSAVKLGQVESCKLGQNYCQPEHILLGILAESDGLPMEDKGGWWVQFYATSGPLLCLRCAP